MKLKVSYTILFLFAFYGLYAQQQNLIEGLILNNRTGKPMQDVNVYIPNTTVGTTTDKDGKFKFAVPQNFLFRELTMSYVGCENLTIPINEIHSSLIMFLEETYEEIDEVIIMPERALENLLKEAYRNIRKNYSKKPTLTKGFYRESLKAYNNISLYYAEAYIDFFSEGYNSTKDMGQARIIKSRKKMFPAHDSLNHILFHGGIYMQTEVDVIKNRMGFINPRNFDDYYYSVDDIIRTNGREIIAIRFMPETTSDEGFYEGLIYVDREDQAFIEFNYEMTDKGIENSNFYKNNPYQRKTAHYHVKYTKYNGDYHMYYASRTGDSFNQVFQTPLSYKNEFLVTSILTDGVKPIPQDQVFEPNEVFSLAAEDFNETNWYEFNFLETNFLIESNSNSASSSSNVNSPEVAENEGAVIVE